MTLDEMILYQIYPLGLCGAPAQNNGVAQNDGVAQNSSMAQNDGVAQSRILKVLDFIPHIKELGVNSVLFNPLFESDAHGYDTRDFSKIDCRLGTNEDFKRVCAQLHENGLNVLLDGVFNHVGRGFWAFQDVCKNKQDSAYRDWFYIHFDGDSVYHDGFWYEGWEGHFELVKLNLSHPSVRDYIFQSIRSWVEDYDINGLRLDVAYSLNLDFLRDLRHFTDSLKRDFVLIGETLHGDYNRWMNEDACHSVTNYECYKGLYSSFNSSNMHEISYSLNRQFGREPWCLYTGKQLMNFVDNHDVSRIATILENKQHLPLIYGLLFGMPGIPCIYYGSEWGIEGNKKDGDHSLRPALEAPKSNELTLFIQKLAKIRKTSKALRYGEYRNVLIEPNQLIFERKAENERLFVAINASDQVYHAHFDAGSGTAVELISGKPHDFGGGSELPPYSCCYWALP